MKKNSMRRYWLPLGLLVFLMVMVSGCGNLTKINELTAQGDEAYKAGNYTAAVDAYTQVLELDAEREIVYNNRGMAYVALDQPEKAIADFASAISLNAEEVTYYYNRGLVYQSIGEYTNAAADFTAAIGLKQDVKDYYLSRGDVYRALDKVEEAEADYTTVLGMDKTDLNALNNRGVIYFQTERYQEAIDDFTAALAHESLSADNQRTLYWNRAEAYRLTYDEEMALADYEAYLALCEEDELDVLEHIAECQESLEMVDEVIDTYTRILALDPAEISASQGRADAYYSLGEYELAAADYTAVLAVEKDYISYGFRGECYYQLERYDEALADLTEAIALNDEYAWAYYVRSNVYLQLQKYDLAKADLDTAATLTGETPEAPQE